MRPSGQKKRKVLLRKRLKRKLSVISASSRKGKSRKIIAKLAQLLVFKKANRICTFMSSPLEVETKALVGLALKLKKTVYAPCPDSDGKGMAVYEVRNLRRDLRRGRFNILEPRKIKARKGRPSSLDLILVPGLGFDRKGGRLGRGAGYFDRYLRRCTNAEKIGLAFREQITKKIPMTRRDVRVDRVITD